MNGLAQLEMTLDEARETDRLIKRHINTTRYLLLDMRDRKGWKALGYESFVEYGEKELSLGAARIYQLADAAEISLQLGFSKILEKQPTESHLVPLKSVPEEDRKAIWDEATRKAEEEHAKLTAKRVEEAVEEWKQRSQESQAESNERRKKIRTLEEQIDLLKAAAKPAPELPVDYEAVKARALQLEGIIETLKNQQAALVADQVRLKLQGYQGEVDALEAKKRNLEQQAKEYQDYLASLTGTAKQMEAQDRAIEKSRQALVDLASEITDFQPINEQLTKKAMALAEMHRAASESLILVFGSPQPIISRIG